MTENCLEVNHFNRVYRSAPTIATFMEVPRSKGVPPLFPKIFSPRKIYEVICLYPPPNKWGGVHTMNSLCFSTPFSSEIQQREASQSVHAFFYKHQQLWVEPSWCLDFF